MFIVHTIIFLVALLNRNHLIYYTFIDYCVCFILFHTIEIDVFFCGLLVTLYTSAHIFQA